MRIIIPNSQLSPAHPTIQSQSYDPWVLMQVPLFWQGSSSHSFTSVPKNFKTGTWVSYKFNNFDYSYILILIYKNCFSQMSSWSGLYMWLHVTRFLKLNILMICSVTKYITFFTIVSLPSLCTDTCIGAITIDTRALIMTGRVLTFIHI